MEVKCGLEGPQTFFPSSSSSERSFSCWMSTKTEAVQFQHFIFQTDSGAKTRQRQQAAEMATGSEGAESDLAGLVHGSGDDERTVPVELHVADFSAVARQDVEAPEKTSRAGRVRGGASNRDHVITVRAAAAV